MNNLQRLERIGHAEIDSDETFRVLLRTSTDVEKVKWFIQCSPESFSSHFVQWAVKFDKRVFLQWLQSPFLPAAAVSDAKLLQRCVHTAFETAHKYKRAEILLWASAFAEEPIGNGN